MKNTLKIFLLLGLAFFFSPAADAQVSVGISIRIAPPALPVYEQPECPVDGWLWQPGYWAYDPADGYYWVPGVWVAPPQPGLLWTPSYWGFDNGIYLFHRGYWARHVGFYGGINYGFGYPGYGFYGGMWSGRAFRYNTAVFRVNRTVVRNVYVNRPTFRSTASRASFNGRGGVVARPRPAERRVMNEHRYQPTRTQISHQQMAGRNPAQRLSANHGRPATPVMNRPANHAVSSPRQVGNRPDVHRSNPAQNHNQGFNRNAAPNHNAAVNRNPGGINRNAPQIDRSNSQHRNIDRSQHVAPQRPQRAEQHNAPQQRQFQQQHVERQNIPRPQQQPRIEPQRAPQHQQIRQPQRMPQPQHMGGSGGQPRPGGGGGQPHQGGGGFGGGHEGGGGLGGGHRP